MIPTGRCHKWTHNRAFVTQRILSTAAALPLRSARGHRVRSAGPCCRSMLRGGCVAISRSVTRSPYPRRRPVASTDLRTGSDRRTTMGQGMNAETVRIAAIVPCHNEEITVAKVVGDLRAAVPGITVYVYDNCSSDRTSQRAAEAGAIVRK